MSLSWQQLPAAVIGPSGQLTGGWSALLPPGTTIPDDIPHGYVLFTGIALPDPVARFLDTAPEDAPRPDDPGFARDTVRVVASASISLEAAARRARARHASMNSPRAESRKPRRHLRGLREPKATSRITEFSTFK